MFSERVENYYLINLKVATSEGLSDYHKLRIATPNVAKASGSYFKFILSEAECVCHFDIVQLEVNWQTLVIFLVNVSAV